MLSRSLVSGRQSMSSPASWRRTSAASSARNRIRPRSTTWSGSFSTRRERNAASIGRKITPCLVPSKRISLGAVLLLLFTLQGIPSVAVTATFHSPRVRESSGIAVSRAHRGVLWTHNDSGDDAYVYATDLAGTDRGAVRIRGARAVDWEDIALGPCPTQRGACLYIADTGDNERTRKSVVIYAVPEPDPPARGRGPGRSAAAATLRLRYRGGPDDVEAIYVSPRDSALYLVTSAAIRPDGRLVAIRTYTEIYTFVPGAGGLLTPSGWPVCNVSGLEPQGEAIDFLDDSTFVLTSEAAPTRRGLIHAVRCPSRLRK